MKKLLVTFLMAWACFSAYSQVQDWTITNPAYDSQDIGVATYDVTKHGVKDDGVTDGTTIIKNLITEISKQGGGVLYFPKVTEGKYIISSSLVLPRGVSLRGDWRKPIEGKSVDGTVLMCTFGKNAVNREFSFAMISMAPSTSVSNLAIWYPDQDPNNVSFYPWTIIFGNAGDWGNEYCHVRNVTFVNAYNAVLHYRISGGGATNVHNVYGTVFNRGLELDGVSEVCRWDFIHWSPKYWAESGLPNAPTSTSAPYAQVMKEKAIGAVQKRNDWSYTSFYEAEGLNVGFHAVVSASIERNTPNGHNYGFILKNCKTGVLCDNISSYGIMFTDMNIIDCERGFVVNSTDNAPVQLSNSTIKADTAILLTSRATSRLMTYQTKIEGGRVVIQNSDYTSVDGDFNNNEPQLEISRNARVILTGNRFAKGECIKNNSFYECHIDHTPISGLKTPNLFTWDDARDVARTRPAKPDVYNVVTDYNAVPFLVMARNDANYIITNKPYHREAADFSVQRFLDNDNAIRPLIRQAFNDVLAAAPDATSAIQNALDDAATNGGGIVYLPAGYYKVLGTLTIPEGVELKGSNDVGTHPMGAGTVLGAFAGKSAPGTEPVGDPFISMEANSGIRGIVIHYPEQDAFETQDFRNTFPYTIRGNEGTYIVNVSVQGAYQAIDLFTNKCDNHFVDYFGGQPFKNTVRVGGGSTGGKIHNIQTNLISFVSGNEHKFGTWTNSPRRDNGQLTNTIKKAVSDYISEQHDFMILGDCSNQIIYNNFGYLAQHGMYFKDEGNGPSGKCLGQGVDAGIISLYYEKLGNGGFDMINSQIVVVQNGDSTNRAKSAYIQTANTFAGEANLFSSDYWGNPATGIIAGGGTLNLYTAHSNAALRNLTIRNNGKVNFYNSNIGGSSLSISPQNLVSNVGVSYSIVDMASGTNENSYAKWVDNLSRTRNSSPNPPVMDRTGWTASASENNGSAQNSIDGNINTSWTSSSRQSTNQWYCVNMKEQHSFNIIYLSSGSSDNYISRFDVYISNDSISWTKIAANISGRNQTVLDLPDTYEAQFIKIQSIGVASNQWTIADFGIADEGEVLDCAVGILNNYADNTQISVYYENSTLFIDGIEKYPIQAAIYNLVGQQLFAKTVTSNIVNVGKLQSGIYILTIKQNDKYFSGKFFAK